MKFKNNKVIFIPNNKDTYDVIPSPKPSKKYIPKWYKDMPTEIINNNKKQLTAKKCMPFLDSLTSGYTQELLCDIEIVPIKNGQNTYVNYKYATHMFKPLSIRNEDSNFSGAMPNFKGYYDIEFFWNSFWEPKTPPGYSTFYFHPANRFDLPFLTHNAIIDTDKWPITGAVPFVIKEGFSGIIPAGTPIYQMLFIKRDNWTSVLNRYDSTYDNKTRFEAFKFFQDGYKKSFWSKKEYN